MEIIQWKYTCLSVVYLCKHFKAVLMILLFSFPYQEQLNIMLFELAQRLHNALSKVDVSFYTTVKDGQSQSQGSCAPLCNHMHPAKLVMVKKEGQNKVLFIPCLFTLLGWKCWSIAFSFLLASFSAHGLFFSPPFPCRVVCSMPVMPQKLSSVPFSSGWKMWTPHRQNPDRVQCSMIQKVLGHTSGVKRLLSMRNASFWWGILKRCARLSSAVWIQGL